MSWGKTKIGDSYQMAQAGHGDGRRKKSKTGEDSSYRAAQVKKTGEDGSYHTAQVGPGDR